MTKAITLKSLGGPEVLTLTDITISDPGPEEVQIRHIAIEVNSVDIQQRQGTYSLKNSHQIPGISAVGTIVKVGAGVRGYKVDDVVAYMSFASAGSYSETRNIHNKLIVAIPPEIDPKTIASCFSKGLMAHSLVCRAFIARPECSILIHSAAGAMGGLISQWCNTLGANVIGTVTDEADREIALAHGCHTVVNLGDEGWVHEVLEATNKVGVNAVYDCIGLNTFHRSLNCLMKMGTMISFDTGSSELKNIDTQLLASKSLFFTAPSVIHYKTNRMELILGFNELCDHISQGSLKIAPPKEFKLSDASEAHKLIENHKNLSSVILLP